MIIIGNSSLIFDFIYIFGKKNTNQYIELPLGCTDEAAFFLFRKAVEGHPGDVVICTQNEFYVKEELQLFGLKACTDYYFFSNLKAIFLENQRRNGMKREEATHLWELYVEIFFSPHGRYYPCHHPLYEAEIASDGNVYTCCSAVMPYEIGNIQKESLGKIWHSARARLLRLSVLNGTAIFCSQEKCENLQLCDRTETFFSTQVSDYPLILNMAIDSSCNLSCPSCRPRVISANGKEIQKKIGWVNNIEQALYANLRHLYIAGNGECMVSKVYQDFLRNRVMRCFSGNLHLVTNGQVWNDTLINMIVSRFCPEVLISVDAWRKETYETLRRGGCYEKVLINIKKYVALKKQGVLSCVTVRFVVQASNYLEIPEFVDGMRNLEVDRMEFTRLVDGGSFTPEAFRQASLIDETGNLKQEYIYFFKENIWPRLGQDIHMDATFLSRGNL